MQKSKVKVKSADTYCNAADYWAPLANYDDDNDSNNDIQNYPSKQQTKHGSALTKPPQHHTTVGADFTHAFSRWLQKRCGMQLIPKTEKRDGFRFERHITFCTRSRQLTGNGEFAHVSYVTQ